MKRVICLLLICFALSSATVSAEPPARPFTGIGLLFLNEGPLADAVVPLYRQPGVGRVAAIALTRFPKLAHVLKGEVDRSVTIVYDKRWPWALVTYDDTGRKGWVSMERAWRYLSWDQYLKGRPLRLLPGLKYEYYRMRQEQSGAPQEESVAGQELRAVEVSEDWCLIVTEKGSFGWVRWRDPDGRLLVSVEAPYGNKSN